jgi:hypothetical protein
MRARIACVLALALAAASPAWAQSEGRPVLADHQFVSTDLIPDAFIRTYVRSDLGVALASAIHYPPLIVAGDSLQALDGALSYARLDAEYQQKLRDWMAVRVAYGLRTRSGSGGLSSVVNEGVTVASGLEFGWLAKLHESHRTSLLGTLAVNSQYVTVVDVKQFAEDVANRVPDARLIDIVPTVRTVGGARFAWAISKQFGTTFLGEGSYGESPRRRDKDSWEYNYGASVDFDGHAAWNIPLGLALAFHQSSIPSWTSDGNGGSSETVLRVAYNARPDFLVAVDALGVFNRENSRAAPVWAGGFSISLRYYF